MGSFQRDASFQASFKRGARVADDEAEEQIPVDDQLNAGRAGAFGRRSRMGSSVTDISSSASMNYGKSSRQDRIGSDSFWCNAFCMHLPSLSRRRPIMEQQQSMSLSESEPDARASTAGPAAEATQNSRVSKAASTERFGKNNSSPAFGMVLDGRGGEEEDDQEVSAYFDLPMELLRSSSVDMESPVTAAFLFDSSRGPGRKKSFLPDNLDFSFPAPPAFSRPSSPPS